MIETATTIFMATSWVPALMVVGALVESMLGVKAVRRSLEHIVTPLSAEPIREGRVARSSRLHYNH